MRENPGSKFDFNKFMAVFDGDGFYDAMAYVCSSDLFTVVAIHA